MGKQKKGEMKGNREGNLASCQLASLCQFVQTEEAQVAVEGQVTGDLTDHTYTTGISLIPPASHAHNSEWSRTYRLLFVSVCNSEAFKLVPFVYKNGSVCPRTFLQQNIIY